jgi:uncharacterized protein (TIGR00297 family)
MRRWMLAPLLALALAGAARRRHALSSSGAAGATAVGTAIFGAGGLRAAALLMLFFGSSTALSRRGGPASGAAPGPERTLAQVLANGGLPAALAVCAHVRPSPRVGAAYAGALAAANADTWATEVGALSPAAPRMITSGRRVPRGVSGAVTPLGTLASLAGALVIGAGHAALTLHPAAALRLGVAGLAGSLADSVLGATLQAVYVCQECGQRTEDRRHAHGTAAPALTLVRGVPLVTNDTVNLCASLVGALTAGLLHHDETAPRRQSLGSVSVALRSTSRAWA